MSGDRIEQFEPHAPHHLANSSIVHKALIHSLSPGDWHNEHHFANCSNAHLPKTELSNHDRAVATKELTWQKQLTNEHGQLTERLGAAHQLFIHEKRDFGTQGKGGNFPHVHISESKIGSDKIHVKILEQEGDSSKIMLEGELDASGKVLTALSAAPATYQHREILDKDNQAVVHSHHHHHNNNLHEHHRPVEHIDFHNGQKMKSASDFHVSGAVGCPEVESSPPPRCQSNLAPGDLAARFQNAEQLSAGQSDKLWQLPDNTVYVRTHLRVDADGGPQWNVDSCGQAGTSLRDRDGKPLNAMAVNYFVLPIGKEWKAMGIRLGDVAWVRNRANGKIVPAIFGDEGPHNKIGEGSQGLCSALGLSNNPFHGGTDQKDIEFLIKPGSGNGKGDLAKDEQQMAARLLGPSGKQGSSLA